MWQGWLRPIATPQERTELHFHVVAVDLPVEVEKVQLQQPLAAGFRNGGPEAEVDHPRVSLPAPPRFDRVHAVGRELLVVRREVSRRITQLPPQLSARHDRAQDGELPSQEPRRPFQVARLHGLPDERGGNRLPVHHDRRQPDDREPQPLAQPREQVQVALASAPEGPVEAHANLTQRTRRLRERRDERFGRRGGERGVERQREAVRRAEVGEELEFMACAGQQTRRSVGPMTA